MVVGLLVGLGVLYGILIAVAGHGVPRGTTALGADVSGLSPAAAAAAIDEQASEYEARSIEVHVGEETLQVRASDVGLGIDSAAMVETAGVATRNPWRLSQQLFDKQTLEPVVTVDETLMAQWLEQAAAGVDVEASDGGVEFDATTAERLEPQVGERLDRDASAQLLRDAFLDAHPQATLPIHEVKPQIDAAEVDRALEEFAEPAMSGPVELTVGKAQHLTVEPAQFGPHLSMVAVDGKLEPRLDAEGLRADLDDQVSPLAREPMDASFYISDGRPKINPSRSGRTLDAEQLSTALLAALPKAADRTATAEFTLVKPEFTTADAKALGINEVVSTFTQNFPYAAYRVTNIGTAANYIDGTLLKPGDTFSMNDTVKERTVANGYTVGTVIAGGRFREELGGGVSTITTAMWHTAFYAGMKRVEQRGHSFYISRYEPGLEATVAWGSLDLKFKNTTPTGILISASITDSSVTITFWGTERWDIDAIFGPRTDVRAFQTVYDTEPGCVDQDGVDGFNIVVTRVFNDLDGNELRREPISTHYNVADNIICHAEPGPTPTKKPKPGDKTPKPTPKPSPSTEALPSREGAQALAR